MSLLLDALSRAQRNKGSDGNPTSEQNVDEPKNEDDLQAEEIVDMEGLELEDTKSTPAPQEEGVGLDSVDEIPEPKPDVVIESKEDEVSTLSIQALPDEIETENNVDSLEYEPSLPENLAELDLDENKAEPKTEEISAQVNYDSLTLEQVPDEPTSNDSPQESVELVSDVNLNDEVKQLDPDLSMEIDEEKNVPELEDVDNTESEKTKTEPEPDVVAATKRSEKPVVTQKILGVETKEKPVDKAVSIENLLEKNKKKKQIISAVSATLISLIISFSGYYYYVGQLGEIDKIENKFANRSLTPIGSVPPEEVDIVEAVESELSNSVAKIKLPREDSPLLKKKQEAPKSKAKVIKRREAPIKQKVNNRSRSPNTTLAKKQQPRRISRNSVVKKENEEASVHTLLITAFNAFQIGNDEVASKKYFSVLDFEKNNRDALLGLGAIAVRQKKLDLARSYYTKILKRNQSDSVARAALVGLVGQLDPIKAETELKLMLKNEPGAGYLHFALGNTYAIQRRWLEAQKAFFNAHRTDENNPDYTYNIAVSLDHLGEVTQAVKFYREALSFSENTKVSFQSHLVKKRIDVLVNSLAGGNR